MSMFPRAVAPVTPEPDGGDLATVTDLAAYRARRHAADAVEATGIALHEELRAEADVVLATWAAR